MSDNGCQISVIMPVHNTGIYLEEALDSLFRQTFSDFEVICVDDSSSDQSTIDILKCYQSMWSQMYVVWLSASVGAAEARNTGMERAKGEYVIFLDSDDLFHQDLLMQMHEKITTTDSDICFCGFRCFTVAKWEHEKLFSYGRLPRTYDRDIQNRPEDWLVYSWKMPWNKLCKRKFLQENHISFQPLSSFNDLYFSCMSEIKATRISFCEKVLIDYRINHANRISENKDLMNVYYGIMKLLNELEIDKGSSLYVQSIIWLLAGMISELCLPGFEDTKKNAYHAVQEFVRREKKHIKIKNRYYRYICECFQDKPYESQWFQCAFSFEIYYKAYADEIKQTMDGHSKIVLWGIGERGQAFQRFCRSEGVSIWGCADIKNNRIGSRTQYNVPIISTSAAAKEADMIVASNEIIYDSIQEMIRGKTIIDLQKYEVVG